MPKEIHPYQVLRRPVVTEKSTVLAGQNKYVFEVLLAANKPQIKAAVETLFKVEVTRVNTLVTKGKTKIFKGRPGRRPDVKKAIVTLAQGHSIDVTTGL